MKVVYVIGKIRDCTNEKIATNIIKARDVAAMLWNAGFAVVCPHLNSGQLSDVKDEGLFIKGDLEFIRRCDFVVVLDNWNTSEGSKGEIVLCIELHKPIYLTVEDAVTCEG